MEKTKNKKEEKEEKISTQFSISTDLIGGEGLGEND